MKFLTLNGLARFFSKIRGIFVGAASNVTEGHIVTFGVDGKTIADGGYTVAADVPADAVFTDTTYTAATTTADGLMSKADKAKVDGIAVGAEENAIESIKVNGTPLDITDKVVNIDLSGYAAEEISNEEIDALFA